MNFWLWFGYPETRHMLHLAKKAEALGFTGAAVRDHVFIPRQVDSRYPGTRSGDLNWPTGMELPDPFVSFAAMAAVTTKLRFVSTVYLLPMRHPLFTAKSVATAAVLADNRITLGIGVGWLEAEFAQLGQDFRTRGKRTEEIIEILRRVWAGGPVEHHGRFYDFGPLDLSPVPDRPVPIWIAGGSDAVLRRAASIADGWIGAPEPMEANLGYLDRLNAALKDVGRAGAPFDRLVPIDDLPTRDMLLQLADRGVDHIRINPWRRRVFGDGTMTLEAKERAMERFSEEIIHGLAPATLG